MIAVRIAPARIPATGLENLRRSPVNSGTSASGFTAPLIDSMPNINTANPRRIVPISFLRELLVKVRRIIPTIASTGEKDLGFKRLIKKLLLSIPVRLKSQEVTVVPIFAPIMMPTACVSFIIPEFTKPTTITVVADEDWITAVTHNPRSTAFHLLEVRFSRICSSFPPDTFARPSPMTCIPYKNRASPPSSVNMLKKSIIFSFFCSGQVLMLY